MSKTSHFAGVCLICRRFRPYVRRDGMCAQCGASEHKRATTKYHNHVHMGEKKIMASAEHLEELGRRAELRMPLTIDPPPGRFGRLSAAG